MHPQTLFYWVRKGVEPNIERLYDPAKQYRAEYIDYLNLINNKYAITVCRWFSKFYLYLSSMLEKIAPQIVGSKRNK